jgi:ankyrin repeat protein
MHTKSTLHTFLITTLILVMAACSKDSSSSSEPGMDIWTALINNRVDVIQEHIATGTDLDQKEPAGGSTPLILASVYGNTEMAKALVEGGADISIKNSSGTTALYNAAFFCHPEIVEILLAKGADPKTTGADGRSIIEVISEPWSPTLSGTYRAITEMLAIQTDLKRFEESRPDILNLLTSAVSE